MMVRSFVALLFVFALIGCNTIHGVGKDLEKAGEAVQGSSK
jgi:predicted small secreted protein